MPEEDQRTRSMWTAVAALAGAATLEVSAASPRIAERCGVERNTYYKQADYCVRSQQAIRYFGKCRLLYPRRGADQVCASHPPPHRRAAPAGAGAGLPALSSRLIL
jgi:hypothetical protein